MNRFLSKGLHSSSPSFSITSHVNLKSIYRLCHVFLVGGCLCFSLLACQPTSSSSSTLDHSSLSTSSYPIVGGTAQPSTLILETEHFWSFGWIHPVEALEEVSCSGILISPVHFLTSAECLTSYHHRFFGITFDPNPHLNTEPFYADIRSAVQHPTLDVAIIEILESPSAYVKPFSLLPSELDSSIFQAGSPEDRAAFVLESVGYDQLDKRNQSSKTVSFLESFGQPLNQSYFQLTSTQGGEFCLGDMGGPVLWQSSTPNTAPFIVGFASKPSPTSNRESSCQGPLDMLRIDQVRSWIEEVLDQQKPTLCRLNSLYCDGVFLHSCPFGREVLSECPEILLCDEAKEHLLNYGSFDEATVSSLRQIEDCNRPPSSGFWNEEIAPPPSQPSFIPNSEGETSELNTMEEVSTGCMQSSVSTLNFGILMFFLSTLGFTFILKHSYFQTTDSEYSKK